MRNVGTLRVKHTTRLIWYNEATARVVCANVPYFLDALRICSMVCFAYIGVSSLVDRRACPRLEHTFHKIRNM
jgi:hypothetical protein